MVDFTGGTWRSLVDGSEVVAIPDSVVERPEDNTNSTTSNACGIIISSDVEFNDQIQVEISSNFVNDEIDELHIDEYDLSNNEHIERIATKDGSNREPNEIVTFDLSSPIDDRNEFAITASTTGNTNNHAFLDPADPPYVSTDEDLKIEAGVVADDPVFADGPDNENDRVSNFERVGNINLS